MKKIIELRPGEGGKDSKMLIGVLVSMYENYATLKG